MISSPVNAINLEIQNFLANQDSTTQAKKQFRQKLRDLYGSANSHDFSEVFQLKDCKNEIEQSLFAMILINQKQLLISHINNANAGRAKTNLCRAWPLSWWHLGPVFMAWFLLFLNIFTFIFLDFEYPELWPSNLQAWPRLVLVLVPAIIIRIFLQRLLNRQTL